MSTLTSTLPAKLKRRLLLAMLESRLGDLREESLNRQGKGHFHVSGRGHEALAAIGVQLKPEDYLAPYYRDRGLVIGRGLTTRQIAMDYFAKRESSSSGRQMPSHYSNRALNIWSVPTPTAAQLLPACGIAWGLQMDGTKGIVVTTLGDASARQGDFYEAICFAQERRLPLLLVVEDNGFGISTPTRGMTPRNLGVLSDEQWRTVDGWDVEQVYAAGQEAIADLRAGRGPVLLWAKMERLSSHTSSDDHAIYRSKEELATLEQRDPIKLLRQQLIADGELTEEQFAKLESELKEKIRADYSVAEKAEEPSAADLETNVWSPPPHLDDEVLKPGKYRMGDVVNLTLRAGLAADRQRVIFGEDVEDPKGGVFRLTQKLSTDFPEQVFNSPLAESTILGVACGLASYGKRPVFEVQFVDFIYPGWNQLVSNLATLRWRTNGDWTCPVVIYAPYGAYLPGGAIWHSQANEAAFAHFPGLSVVIPSTPEDAAGLLWTAMHADDPVIFLAPKHMLWAETTLTEPALAVPIGHARRRTEGSDVTVVAWGNTIEKAFEAMDLMGDQVSVELIDLRSVVPWDRETIEESVRKTGRLVIVQEDTENCSVGQMIISHLAGRADVWSRMVSPPVLVSKGNVLIGYNPIHEYAALPDTARIAGALQRVMAITMERGAISAGNVSVASVEETRESAPASTSGAPHGSVGAVPGAKVDIPVKVPIMGEGIRSARVVTLHKKAGDAVHLDDTLCEVETDKAVYPIEASFAGTFKGWTVKADETVEIGQEIAFITGDAAAAPAASTSHAPAPKPAAGTAARASTPAPARSASVAVGAVREPALSSSITKRLSAVVAANMHLDVPWKAMRTARAAAKAAKLDYSPSMMLAWSVARAMSAHASFRCIVDRDGRILEQAPFDLGVAVALEGDRLATAVVRRAGELKWPDFAAAYAQALTDARAGKIEDVTTPLNLTSLGAFGIERATPIVVPPAMSTLFVGTAHERMINDGGVVYPQEVATLSLTFDHRVVNGAGAAAFMHDLKAQIENFQVPA
ncbi:2-oxo acid dehydrogenase subunit E2 [Horticoccus luteus]|uniref:3-methyl-2-oxobutanoate dehydrogenase (2-methylpropanoyl-transferring) n=1 Tax=Horticoccus luteus TaxID=2862869 RepID=A0A8F9XHQ4_9BACT|nr:thiamine pyrophosphate-dependent enzyme [Horticoccus luteus]QYM79585.1 2-oxo acid dehydrogenase subunit E2 [Horticoccus luteus]